jgi:hypothetical protein
MWLSLKLLRKRFNNRLSDYITVMAAAFTPLCSE